MTIFVVQPFSDALKAIIFKDPLRGDFTWRGVGHYCNYGRGISSPADNLADGSSGNHAICVLGATPYPMSITPPVGGRVDKAQANQYAVLDDEPRHRVERLPNFGRNAAQHLDDLGRRDCGISQYEVPRRATGTKRGIIVAAGFNDHFARPSVGISFMRMTASAKALQQRTTAHHELAFNRRVARPEPAVQPI